VIARAFAPASVANVAVGFDILGHAIAGVGDTVSVRRIDEPVVRIEAIRGSAVELPLDAAGNTAGAALMSLREGLGLDFGFAIEIDKGIPFGSGMGGSAASSVAALVAANALLDAPLAREALYPFALDGEAVASGGRHGDNVGPLLLGGLALCTADRLLPVPVPASWHSLLVHPHAVLETRRARQALQGSYALGEFVAQSANLALVLSGCHRSDASLVRAGLRRAGGAAPRRTDYRFRSSTRRGAVGPCDGRGHLRCRTQRVRLVRGCRPGPCRSGTGVRSICSGRL